VVETGQGQGVRHRDPLPAGLVGCALRTPPLRGIRLLLHHQAADCSTVRQASEQIAQAIPIVVDEGAQDAS